MTFHRHGLTVIRRCSHAVYSQTLMTSMVQICQAMVKRHNSSLSEDEHVPMQNIKSHNQLRLYSCYCHVF